MSAGSPDFPDAGYPPPSAPGPAPAEAPPEEPPEVEPEDIDELAEARSRVSRDNVVYAYCNINATNFTGRDSIDAATGELFVARVRPDHLRKLSDVYEPPDCAAHAAARLAAERVVCLRGAEGSGRTALAIQLLHDRAAQGVWQIRPHTPLAELSAASFTAKRGYFLSLSPGGVVSDFELSRLRTACETSSCYLILICPPRGVETFRHSGVIDVAAPRTDRVRLLRRHITRELTAEAGPAVDTLLSTPEVGAWCQQSHRLADLDVAASILTDLVAGRIERAALAEHLGMAGAEGMQAWFSRPGQEPLRPLRITLALFGGLPVHTVLELEDRLSLRLRDAAGETQPRDLFAVSGRTRLADVSAHISVADREDHYGPVRSEIVEFADRTWADSLARLLRHHYPGVRPELIAWLRELTGHPDPHVQQLAALALGGFIEDNLPVLVRDVIEPWARQADRPSLRKVVWALTAPLQNAETVPRVSRVLQRWAGSGDPGLVRSAAMVYGLALAPADPAETLSGLARIARLSGPGGRGSTMRAASGVRAMYLNGLGTDVLSALRHWAHSGRQAERDLAFATFKLVAKIEKTVCLEDPAGGHAGAFAEHRKQTWPALLLAAEKNGAAAGITEVARGALNCPEWSAAVLEALARWFARADGRPYLMAPLINFAAALATTSGEADRLAYHLQAWARQTPGGAAARACTVLLETR